MSFKYRLAMFNQNPPASSGQSPNPEKKKVARAQSLNAPPIDLPPKQDEQPKSSFKDRLQMFSDDSKGSSILNETPSNSSDSPADFSSKLAAFKNKGPMGAPLANPTKPETNSPPKPAEQGKTSTNNSFASKMAAFQNTGNETSQKKMSNRNQVVD